MPIEGEHGPITPHLVKHACRHTMCRRHASVFRAIRAELKIGTSKKSESSSRSDSRTVKWENYDFKQSFITKCRGNHIKHNLYSLS